MIKLSRPLHTGGVAVLAQILIPGDSGVPFFSLATEVDGAGQRKDRNKSLPKSGLISPSNTLPCVQPTGSRTLVVLCIVNLPVLSYL